MKTDLQLLDVTGLNDSSVEVNFELNSNSSRGENLVYNEMSDFPIRSRTEIETLTENMMVLRDLSARLGFMSREIKYLMNLK